MDRRISIALLVLVVALTVLTVWWLAGPRPVGPGPDGGGGELSTAELRELVDESRRGVALLENEDVAAAIPVLESIREQLPSDPFAPRNLVIARLIALEAEAAVDAEATAAVRRDLTPLAEREGGTLPLRLSARLDRKLGDPVAAANALEEAIERDPDDASLQYELWQLQRDLPDEDARERGLTALLAARVAAPSNVFVLVDLLVELAQREDARLSEEIPNAVALLEPYAQGIEGRTTADVVALLEAAGGAIGRGDWPLARRNVRIVANVVRPEAVSQSDRLRVDRNLLEFVAFDFEPSFYERANWRPPEPAPAIPVEFVVRPLDVAVVTGAPRALMLRDVDLDGDEVEIVLLDDEELVVLTRRDGTYEPMASIPAVGFAGVLVADLDTDVPVRELHEEVVPEDGDGDDDATTGAPEECHVADLDFVLWGPAGIRVVENRLEEDGTRRLVAVDQLPEFEAIRDATAAVLADVDHDGDLDLVIGGSAGIEIHANRGDLVFEPLLGPIGAAGATSLLPVDVDGDLDVDVVVTADEDRGGWLENLRHGELRWRPDPSIPRGPAVGVIDEPGGRWSLVAQDEEGVSVRFLASPPGVPLLGAARSKAGEGAKECLLLDYDNDGARDLAHFGESGVAVLRSEGMATFGKPRRVVESPVAACDFADVDDDGDLDLVAADPSGSLLFVENEGGNANHWLRIALRAQQIRGEEEAASGRVNQYGIGSLLEARVGAVDLRRIVRRPWTHIGLGRAEGASAVRVLWTNGIPFNLVAPRADQLVCERQTLKGSCPYLYAWDGERFRFVTDLLWGSPIGLQFADGVLAPARPWEHLLVPGESLVPRDGFYEMRITEELWEVGYFDHVALLAVDHPEGTAMFTNEKVGPPGVAEPGLHFVGNPVEPVSIRDSNGRNLLPALRAADETYARGFSRKFRQGLVEEHFLEIDLGPRATEASRITLFLTGWLQPSDTSLNVALSHDPRFPSPTPPSLQVVGPDGEWTTAVPYTGFPGGKTKTIALDVSNVFPTEDRRLRLATNMEFYWDHVFFTVDEPNVDRRITPLRLAAANLRYRGFSRETLPPGLGPHRYDYEDVSRESRWPPIRGGFTRYGDIRELLADEDDRLVVLGSGDEVALRFEVPRESPPPGWRRDFVLTNVGWDKDADLNTVLGQTVEPLPFRAMSRYPYGAVEEYPSNPRLERDRREFHVRRQRSLGGLTESSYGPASPVVARPHGEVPRLR